MLAVATQFVCMAFSAITGLGFGWWLRGSSSTGMSTYEDDPEAENGMERANEILSRLQELAVRMASDVGEHSTKVQEANEELVAAGAGDSETVLRAVAKLLDANQKMQEQLASAETRLEAQAQEIESYATEARTDALTGLPNRRAFAAEITRRFSESQQTGKPLCLVMLDVDHFKKFNDTYGHPAGDEVLSGVADVLRNHAGQHAMAARFGGEEFVLILPGRSIPEAMPDVEQLRQAIADLQFRFDGKVVGVTASMGMAQRVADEPEGELIARSDSALYAAKEGGRNCIWWHDGDTAHRAVVEWPAKQSGAAADEPVADNSLEAKSASRVVDDAPPSECAASSESCSENSPPGGGLPKRMAFCTLLRHRLAEWKRSGPAPSVVLVRIDRLNQIREVDGQRAAALLMEVTAKYLAAATRDGDVVGQYDDTAFAVLLPGCGMLNMVAIAERLRATIAECELALDGREQRFTVSIGGAEVVHGDDTARLLRRTEEALTAAMKAGGNCAFFHNGNWSETVAATLERLQGARAV